MNKNDRDIPPQIKAELALSGEHGHLEEHFHGHVHGQMHEQIHQQIRQGGNISGQLPQGEHGHRHKYDTVLTIRSHSGLSGDMLLAGLAVLRMEAQNISPDSESADMELENLLCKIMPQPACSVKIRKRLVNGISGWSALVELPHAHEHRTLSDISRIIEASELSPHAIRLAKCCFELLAQCEAEVHGRQPDEIHFHEVGALDSILDICVVCELFTLLEPGRLICSPLPMADGHVQCAHGILPAPAPAVLRLLKDIPVREFPGDGLAGELVTPTAVALLRVLNAEFGGWPHFRPETLATVYGQREFAHAPNGAIFALGHAHRPGSL